MPQISHKGHEMPASPIRKLVPFADAAKQRGVKVYHLNIGQPDIASPKIALNAVKDNHLNLIEYSHSAGNLSLRRKLVDYYKRFGIDVNENQIIVTNGGSEAILLAFVACLNPGDEVIVTEPFYANYAGFGKQVGVKTVPIVSRIENSFALPPIEEFEKKITPATRAIMICNPNNPTGYLYSEEELRMLAQIVKKHDLFLFSDEVYREFCYDGSQFHSVMHLEGVDDNLILLDSISKRYSACGCRLGMLVTRNKEVYSAVMKIAQARLSPPSYAQIFAEAALDAPESYFTEVLSEYTRRRNIVVSSINKMEGCFCPNPKGAFYAVARLPIDDADRFCQWLLEDFSIDGKTVMLAPATGFYSTPGSGKNEVRISYVLKEEDLHQAMFCLEEALKVYPGRTR